MNIQILTIENTLHEQVVKFRVHSEDGSHVVETVMEADYAAEIAEALAGASRSCQQKQPEKSLEQEIHQYLGEHNAQAIADVAIETGWTAAALRSIASEELEHGKTHKPYCYAISQRAELLRERGTK